MPIYYEFMPILFSILLIVKFYHKILLANDGLFSSIANVYEQKFGYGLTYKLFFGCDICLSSQLALWYLILRYIGIVNNIGISEAINHISIFDIYINVAFVAGVGLSAMALNKILDNE